MEDAEGVLSFDFEGGLDTGPLNPSTTGPVLNASDHSAANAVASSPAVPPPGPGTDSSAGGANVGGRRSFRQTVCRHWLRSLCMKGDACGFLHQYDKSRMPICRFFRLYGECREQDCVYKHTNEDIKECNMYKLGFCPNGPDCRYRHAKLPGPPPSVEEVLQKIQQLTSYYGNSNRFFQQRSNGVPQQVERSQLLQGPNQAVKASVTESANLLPQQQQVQQGQQLLSQAQSQTNTTNLPNQPARGPSPLPQGVSRYFIVKSCNRENLEVSVQQGVWATQRSNEPKLNEAFDSTENVILIFSVNRTRHFQGCAKMTSKIGGAISGGNWKYAHGTAHYGRNFSVKWLKLCELSFQKTRHLRNPYNENLPVKISRDCQELEPSIGEQLASLLYLEPDSELMAVSVAAETKREEEKAKGLNTDGVENPDIVPFDDEEEEEEEEESEEEEDDEEEEEESYGPGPHQGRGRGRGGMMWPPMPMGGRGIRPMPPPGMRGGAFPPMGGMNMMMGGDGFPYGPPPEGFGMPELFGMGPPRPPFPPPPYGGHPRFPGEFPGPGMMFPGRPPAQPFPPGPGGGGGFGMMMGGGRGGGPFMGGGRGGPRPPVGGILPPPPPPPQNSGRVVKKGNDNNNNRYNNEQGSSRGGQEGGDEEQQYSSAGNSFNRNDDSASEDEAPRRSRHGEGKKKRRVGPEGSDDPPPTL